MSTVARQFYPKEPLTMSSGTQEEDKDSKADSNELVLSSCKAKYIDVKDHTFDRFHRRKKKTQSKPSDISQPRQVSRGCLPIRQYHKCDESKILATTCLGIDITAPFSS